MLEVPYKQIKTEAEKAAFYLGYLWESLVDSGVINPKTVKLFGNKENVIYDDYVEVFGKIKSIIRKRHINQYDEIIDLIEENLFNDEEYNVRHATFYNLGSLYASNVVAN